MFVKTQGRKLIDPITGCPMTLRGFNFTQNYWMPADVILRTGLDDEAYKYASRLGANSIRLTVSHRFLEPLETPFVYNEEALKWLDLQINHAKQNNLYVSIALVLPHGGDWLDKEEGKDFRIWHHEEFQIRFIEVWRTLARRYAQETTVLGYDLFNVPVTDDQSGEAYFELLHRSIQHIRAVDSEHLIVVSKLYGCHGEIDYQDSYKYYHKVNWDNILYDGHFYDPVKFTHQYAEWMGYYDDGGSYPDDSILEVSDMGVMMPRNKSYLNERLRRLIEFGERNDVPIHLGEIGLIHICYEDKGGLSWISDVIEILTKNGVGFFYWDFQSLAMGLINQSSEEKIDEEKVNHALAVLLFGDFSDHS